MGDSKQYVEFVRAGAKHYGIDPDLAFAMFETESNWNPEARSSAGALGIAQLMPETAKSLGVDPIDTWDNIDGGLRYLKQQLDKFGKPDLAVAAYNAGPGAVEKAGGIPLNAETPSHVQKVMSRYGQIRETRAGVTRELENPETMTPIDATQPQDIQGGLLSRFASGLTDFASTMLKAPAVVSGEMTRATQIPQTLAEAKMPFKEWMGTKYEPEQQLGFQLGEALSQRARGFLGTTPPAETYPEKVAEGLGTAAGFMAGMRMPPALYGAVSPLMTPLEGMIGQTATKAAMPTATEVLSLAPGAPITQASQYAQKLAAGVADYVRPALLGSIFSQVGGYERAKQQLGTPDALDASRWNGMAGLIMGAPFGRVMSRINQGTGGLIGNMIKGGVEMTGSMAIMRMLDNVFDHMNYDDKRNLLDGVVEAMPVDMTVGMILPMFHKALKQRIDEGKEPELKQYVEEKHFDERSQSWWVKYEHGWYEAEPGEGPPPTPEVKAAPTAKKTELSDAELEKKVQQVEKKEYGEKQLAHVQQHYRDAYGLEFDVSDAETPGKFKLTRKAAEAPQVEEPIPPRELHAELEQNERDNAAEIPVNVPAVEDLPPGIVRTKEPLTSAQRESLAAGREMFERWQQGRQAAEPVPAAEPATSVNPVAIGKTEAEQVAIDDAAVQAYENTKTKENPKGSYVQAAKEIGLSIAETKARIKYALGQSEKRPYEIVEAETAETKPPVEISSPLIREETAGRAGGTEAPPEFSTKAEASIWLEDNKMIGTVVPKGKGFKILDLRPEGSAKFYSLQPISPWFSKLQEEIVKDHANWPKHMSGMTALDKMRQLVEKGKGKKEELEDTLRLTGLKKRLEGMEKASKDDVLNEIMSNGIEVEERWYGGETAEEIASLQREGPAKYDRTPNYNLGGPREGYFELVLTSPQAGEMPTDASHFIEGQGKRQIGWVRGDWRTDAEGKRILFIEEVQSKRHQEGREEGYKDSSLLELLQRYEDANARDMRAIFNKDTSEVANPEETAQLKRELEIRTGKPLAEAYTSGVFMNGTPDAPFRQSWLRLIARRLLRYAAENNADAVAWTTGEQQAERWSLRQVADRMLYDEGTLIGYKNGLESFRRDIAEKDLPEYIGKDLARQVLSTTDNKVNKQIDKLIQERNALRRERNMLQVAQQTRNATSEDMARLVQIEEILQQKEEDLAKLRTQYEDKAIDVPEGTEFYASKWPEKIYGFAGKMTAPFEGAPLRPTGGYENALLGTAMQEAMGQFREKGIGEVEGKPPGRFEVEPGVTDKELSKTMFSRQPSVSLTPEAKAFWRQNPMQMYSMSPFMMTPENARGLKEIAEDQMVRGGVPRDIARGYKSDDIGPLEKFGALTQWLVDKNPRLYPLFEATHRKVERALTGIEKAIEGWAGDWLEVSRESKRLVTDTLVELDRAADKLREEGKSAYKERGIDEPRFKKTAQGNIVLREEYLNQWKEKTRPFFNGTDAEFELAYQQRLMYDKILEAKWNIMRKFFRRGSQGLRDLRHEVFELEDYFPHTRTGEFAAAGYVKLPDGTMKKVYDHAFDAPFQLYELQRFGNKFEVKRIGDKASYGTYKTRELAEAARKKLGAEYHVEDVGLRGVEGYFERVVRPKINEDPVLADLGVEPGDWKIERRESPYIQGLINQPLIAMALQATTDSAIRTIRKNPKLSAEQKEAQIKAYSQLWNDAVAQTLKKSTMGGHQAKRTGVYGYDTSDAGKIGHAYAEQFYHTLAKLEMVADLTRLASAIKGDRPREAKYAANYMQRILNPTQDLGKILYGLRGLSYWTMINPIKFFGGNLTNGLVGGVEQIVTDVGQKAWKYFPSAFWDTVKWYSKKGKLTVDEERMFKELYDNGVAKPQYLDAMGMRLKQDPNAGMARYRFQQAKNFLSWPARTSEIVSRLYTALAAYRAAKDGLITSDRALERFGPQIGEKVEGKPTEEQYQRLTRYASKIVDDSHMIWGELNRPEAVSEIGPLGRVVGSALIFRHYAQGLAHMWKSMWKEGRPGDRRGQIAMAESMVVQMLLGGVIGGSILNAAYQQWYGTNMWDDMRKRFGSKPTDAARYGPLALTGFNYHSSFDMEPPTSWDDLFGVPASLVKNYVRAWESAGVKDYMRAFEYAVPLKMARDISVGIRQHTVGLTTPSGKPIPGPEGGSEPYKTSLFDAIKQAGGFTPLEVTKLQDTRRDVQDIETTRQNKQDELVTRYVNARRAGNWDEIDKIWAEADAWNDKWIAKGVPQLTLRMKDGIKARMRPEKPSKKMRGLAREMRERAMGLDTD